MLAWRKKMLYFHREVLRSLDIAHLPHGPPIPCFSQNFVLWEIRFRTAVNLLCDVTTTTAAALGIIPSLMLNPSQDYWHLKDKRAQLEALGYKGLRAPSSRCTKGGHILALFDDQSKNVDVTPFETEFRLITQSPLPSVPFTNHMTQTLDFTSGEVKVDGAPSGNTTYSSFAHLPFNH